MEYDLDAIVEKYYPIVLGYVRKHVPESDVEDVVQDVFMNVVKSIHTFRGDSEFGTWLSRILRNKVADYYRKLARWREVDLEPEVWRRIASEVSLQDDRLEWVISCLEKEQHRQVLRVFLSKASFGEMAEELELTYEATRSRYKRAVAKARVIAQKGEMI
jgi:RNA polymerase sigma-70 factor (ECF subfamily)